MTHVVTENCILCKHTDCVDACPVDCFRVTPFMLVIDPDECIDCAVCTPVCPVNAIFAEEDVPLGQSSFIAINQKLSAGATSITRRKAPLINANIWKGIPGKAILVELGFADSQFDYIEEHWNRYQGMATKESLTPSEWESALIDLDPMVRLVAAARPDFVMNKERVDRGVSDISEFIRKLHVVKGNALLSSSQIYTLLRDPSFSVRLELVKFCASRFTTNQVEYALNSSEFEIRLAVICSAGFCPTRKQFLRGLEAEMRVEAVAMLDRMTTELAPLALDHSLVFVRSAAYGFMPLKLTSDQIETGLQDLEEQIRRTIINRTDIELTVPQFLAALKTGCPDTIYAASRKASEECIQEALKLDDALICARVISMAPSLTIEQVDCCLADHRSAVALATVSKIGQALTQQQVSSCLQSTDQEVRRLVINLYGLERLTAKQFASCLSDPDELIRCLAVLSPSFTLSEGQIEQALVDRTLRIRGAAASRQDFLPNELQLERGLNDKSKKIREIYLARFSVASGRIFDVAKPKSANPERQLKTVLKQISGIETWTSRKYQLKDELIMLLQKLDYLNFSSGAGNAWLSRFGEHAVIVVPDNKRGPLQAMRGRKVHLVCLGHGRYSTIYFAAKIV